MDHHYSGRNQVPKVPQQGQQTNRGANNDRPLPPTPSAENQSEKDHILSQSKKQTPLQKAQEDKRDDTVVSDPTTGAPVHIEPSKPHHDKNYAEQLDAANVAHPGPALNPPQDPTPGSFKIAPNSAQPTNVLLQRFPAPVEAGLVAGINSRLRQVQLGVVLGIALIWLLLAFENGHVIMALRSGVLATVALSAVTALHLVKRQILRNLSQVRMQMERQRGEEHSPPTPESAEWLNGIIATVWPLVPETLFTSLTDTLEDVMQASLPKFVTAVRIADLDQGRNPLRIVSIRALPDQQGSRLKHGEDWIGKKEEDLEKLDQADDAGDFVNMEVSLAYMSLPKTAGQAIHAHNAHLKLEFFLGASGWARIPIRVWVEISGITATARMRVQMVEQVPFIRNCILTLMGTPYVDVSAVPLARALPNVLDLPIISSFVRSSIAAACQMYQAPRSITLNLAQLLMGDGTKKDTSSVGVLMLTIHHAAALAAADADGKSDPYVVAAWSKFGKPLYSTRVMAADLNPVWEETFFLPVTVGEIRSEERLSIQLWDADARSADDVLGRVEVDLLEIMGREGEVVRRADRLKGFEEAQRMPGEVHWSYGFYRKVPLEQRMKEEADQQRAGEASEEKSRPDMKPTVVDTPAEAQTLDTPPNLEYPSGIFSIVISNINNLENQNLVGHEGKSMKHIAGKPGQPTADDAQREEHEDLPNSYCEIMINDDLVYRTRTKEMTSAPYFAAGTERFLRDYRATTVRVAVRDARLREHDALLGVITLPLGELFRTQSQVTRLFSLQDGVGFGRVNLSLLFRGVDVRLPRALRGWETGTVEVHGDVRAVGLDSETGWAGKKLTMRTSDDVEKVSGSAARREGSDIVWAVARGKVGEGMRRLPVYHRYASALVLEIGKPDALAVLWLQDIVDGEEKAVELDIMKGAHLQQLAQCYISDHTKSHHPYEVIGKLHFKVRFDPGLDEEHERLATDQRRQHTMDAYMAAEGTNAQIEKQQQGRAEDEPKTAREKQLERRDLHRRNRGVMQVKPIRTAKWLGDGIKSKTHAMKERIVPSKTAQEPDVETEV